jgi:hypothetical protein
VPSPRVVKNWSLPRTWAAFTRAPATSARNPSAPLSIQKRPGGAGKEGPVVWDRGWAIPAGFSTSGWERYTMPEGVHRRGVLRAARDPTSSIGWKVDVRPFPGWEMVPTW